MPNHQQTYADVRAVSLDNSNFSVGSLRFLSNARPGKVFTASSSLIRLEIGVLKGDAFERVLAAFVALLQPKPKEQELKNKNYGGPQ